MNDLSCWVDGTIFSPTTAAELTAALVDRVMSAGFTLLAENQNPRDIAEAAPGGRIYAGTFDYMGEARPALILIRDKGEFVVAIQVPEKDDEDDELSLDAVAIAAVVQKLDITPGDFGASDSTSASIVNLKALLGRMVRNEL